MTSCKSLQKLFSLPFSKMTSSQKMLIVSTLLSILTLASMTAQSISSKSASTFSQALLTCSDFSGETTKAAPNSLEASSIKPCTVSKQPLYSILSAPLFDWCCDTMKGKCQPNPVFCQRIDLCIAGKLSGSGKPLRVIKLQLLCLNRDAAPCLERFTQFI